MSSIKKTNKFTDFLRNHYARKELEHKLRMARSREILALQKNKAAQESGDLSAMMETVKVDCPKSKADQLAKELEQMPTLAYSSFADNCD
jgi:hypothetical protein